jgi:uncharacterized protein (TIGR03435 family)
MPLFQLLAKAYDLAPEAIDGPAWIKDFSGENWYDIEAKMPPATTVQDFQLMLQTLLVDRFGLKVHREMKKIPGYRLIVQKAGSKLKATPSGTAMSSEQVGVQTRSQLIPLYNKDGTIQLPPREGMVSTVTPGAQHVAYRGVTLDQFAEKLGRMINASVGAGGNGPIPHVVNQTGLQGRYDFTLDFACALCQSVLSKLPQFQGRQEVALSDAQVDGAARFPNLFEALQGQLGLRLEKADNVPIEIMVVDAALKIPGPN